MKKIVLALTFCLSYSAAFSQVNWRKGGNNATPPGQPSSIGTDASWNAPFLIMTNGTQRVLIDNGGVGVNTGRVVFGNDLPNNFTPQARLHLHQTGGVVATRFTNDNTGFTANDGLAIGIL